MIVHTPTSHGLQTPFALSQRQELLFSKKSLTQIIKQAKHENRNKD
jgi:hypothetical protein